MGFFDRLTGTEHPDRATPPRSAQEVREALLALNGPDVPFVVRGGDAEGADLVAEWRISDPAWHTFFVRTQVSRVTQFRMRLVPASHEVRVVDRQFEVSWVGGTPRLAVSAEASRGQVKTVSWRRSVERGPEGGLQAEEIYRFDTSDLKDPLRTAVLGAGWTWRGALFKL
ncbi:hypothetical protein AB0O42_32875 [Streptomyces sp. NPDC089922]|uniref:hypothetical protein n=1 Tax=unclassified Streptomyces TaxID=2593676 RepID=UPI0033DC3A1F